jgi:tetratricopeptide (TPR) repeat protein
MGRCPEAIAKQEASLEMNREDGNEEGQAISLHQLSVLYGLSEDYPTALARSQEAEALARKLGLEDGTAKTLHEQGLIYNCLADAARMEDETTGHRQQAFERFQESLEIAQRIGGEAGAADSLGELGKLLMDAGQMWEAIAAFTEFAETHRRLGNPVKVGIGLEFLGAVHERQGQYPAALEKYEQALALYRQYAPPEIDRCKRNIALLRGKMGGG